MKVTRQVANLRTLLPVFQYLTLGIMGFQLRVHLNPSNITTLWYREAQWGDLQLGPQFSQRREPQEINTWCVNKTLSSKINELSDLNSSHNAQFVPKNKLTEVWGAFFQRANGSQDNLTRWLIFTRKHPATSVTKDRCSNEKCSNGITSHANT